MMKVGKCIIDCGAYTYHYFVVMDADGCIALRASEFQQCVPKEAEKLMREDKFFRHVDAPTNDVKMLAWGKMYVDLQKKNIEIYGPMEVEDHESYNSHSFMTKEDVKNLLCERFPETNEWKYFLL